jgi:uncharacterized protein (DUF1786 family)
MRSSWCQNSCSFNFRWSETDPVSFLQLLVPRARLPVDADQIVGRVRRLAVLCEELIDDRVVCDFDVVSKATAIVVDYENSHVLANFLVRGDLRVK